MGMRGRAGQGAVGQRFRVTQVLLQGWFAPAARASDPSGRAEKRLEMAWWRPRRAVRLAPPFHNFAAHWLVSALPGVDGTKQVYGGRDGWIHSNAFSRPVCHEPQPEADVPVWSVCRGRRGPDASHRGRISRLRSAACCRPACRRRRRPERTGPRAQRRTVDGQRQRRRGTGGHRHASAPTGARPRAAGARQDQRQRPRLFLHDREAGADRRQAWRA